MTTLKLTVTVYQKMLQKKSKYKSHTGKWFPIHVTEKEAVPKEYT